MKVIIPTDDEYRQVLGAFCSGITVVTTAFAGTPIGMTCQSFFSVSLDPPMIAFSPARTSTTYPVIRETGAFAVNVLSDHQSWIAGQFARRGVNKWKGIRWTAAEITGCPLLDEAIATVECVIEQEYSVGDHFITIGSVQSLRTDPAKRPLLYFRSQFSSLAS
jgi:3-hydroxy-9,10-secoandrosta-1,3,5(10)-triene-9,17-dione monooxygenase reductase component